MSSSTDRGFGKHLRAPAKGSTPEVDKKALVERQEHENSELKKAPKRQDDRGFGRYLPPRDDDGSQRPSGPQAWM